MHFDIKSVGRGLEAELKQKIDQKTKPVGSLGLLELLALRIGLVQRTLTPVLRKPSIAVFAGDHGATEEGISAYPSEVTAQMVQNFLAGGAAINVFARLHDINLLIVDAGVGYDFEGHPELIHAKVAPGTRNYLHEPAMTYAQCEQAVQSGAAVVSQLHRDGCNIIGFGEMGIGNTASAALLMSVFCSLPLERCVGAGTGLDEDGIERKLAILKRARQRATFVNANNEPLQALSEFGGFEIAMICGGMLRAAELDMLILVDGFVATSALLAAKAINRHVMDYCISSHRSGEAGHTPMLKQLGAMPLLNLEMRLGEGTGAALAFPLAQAAVAFLNEMASFEEAGVSEKSA